MKNQLSLASLCLCIISFSGCFVAAKLDPVHGPAMAEPHQAVIKPSGAFNSGKFYADLQNDRVFRNDECKGRWKSATRPMPPNENDMTSIWDAVYGDGYYKAQILAAKKCVRGSGACKNGKVLDAEICETEDKQTGRTTRVGVARDNKNNIYRIVF